MITRYDLATTIHKAVRKLLFEQALLLARCDFRDEASCREACGELDRVFFLLREHAEHEDDLIFPALGELDAALACEAARQHLGLEQQMREIERTAVNLRFATSAERLELGNLLGQRFNQFVAAQLAHLSFEEVEMQRVFWEKKTDDELRALHLALRTRVPPARARVWVDLMLQVGNAAELSQMGPPPGSPAPQAA
ncbi:MAG: hypothetical protein ABW061_00650 [Polyangiaceae bacterium]